MPSEKFQNFFITIFSGAMLLMTAAFARVAFNVNLDGPGVVRPVFNQAVAHDCEACSCQNCEATCCQACGKARGKDDCRAPSRGAAR